MEVITSETGVTIGLLITVMAGVIWLSRIWATGKRNEEEIKQISDSINHIEEVQSIAHEKTAERIRELDQRNVRVLDRVARIETKIDLMLEYLKK